MANIKHRFDAHAHGPIGTQRFYLKAQRYAGKNLLQLMSERCFQRDLSICAITSHYDVLDEPNDRFKIITEYESQTMPAEYDMKKIGENLFSVQKDKKKVIFVNGQTVMAKEGENHYDILVVGNNKVPNNLSVKDTLTECRDMGLIAIAEHPYVWSHRGMGEILLSENKHFFDAIEGHNSQMIFPHFMSRLPVIGRLFGEADSHHNQSAQQFAVEHKIPWIATSDSHRVEDTGLSYIEWNSDEELPSDEKAIISRLKNRIKSGDFSNHMEYANPFAWAGWVSLFLFGTKTGLSNPGQKYYSCETL